MLILLTSEPAPRTVPDGGCRENPSLSASQRGDLKSRLGPASSRDRLAQEAGQSGQPRPQRLGEGG